VGVVYYRAGYSPVHYPSENEWKARLLIERYAEILTYGEGALNIVTFQVKSNKMPFNQLPFGWYQKGPTSVNPTRNFRTVPVGQKESGNNPQHFRPHLLFGFQRGRRKSYSNSIARTRKVLYAIFLTSLHYFVFTLQICVETSKRRGWKQRLRS